jgi:hypothetical protein
VYPRNRLLAARSAGVSVGMAVLRIINLLTAGDCPSTLIAPFSSGAPVDPRTRCLPRPDRLQHERTERTDRFCRRLQAALIAVASAFWRHIAMQGRTIAPAAAAAGLPQYTAQTSLISKQWALNLEKEQAVRFNGVCFNCSSDLIWSVPVQRVGGCDARISSERL